MNFNNYVGEALRIGKFAIAFLAEPICLEYETEESTKESNFSSSIFPNCVFIHKVQIF